MSEVKYSIVIPAYNEEIGIISVLKSLRELGKGVEIIVVDDGSSDDTAKIVSGFESVRLISHQMNLGYGGALKTGIKAATGEFVVMCDADGQHTVQDIQKVMSYSDEFDMVVGTRGTDSHIQRERVVGKKVISMVGNYLSGEKIPDINSGLRVIKRELIGKYLHLLPNSFSASTTTTMIFLKRQYFIKWVPITTMKREGQSTVRQFKHGFYTLYLIQRIITLFNPFKVFFPAAMFLMLFGIIWGVWYLPYGGLSIFAGIVSLTGFIVLMFGILCDQISQLRLEKYE